MYTAKMIRRPTVEVSRMSGSLTAASDAAAVVFVAEPPTADDAVVAFVVVRSVT